MNILGRNSNLFDIKWYILLMSFFLHRLSHIFLCRFSYNQEKHCHTIKAQLVICALTLQILSVVMGKGRQHDFLFSKPVDYCSIQIRNYSLIRVIKELLGIIWIPSFHSKRKKDSPLPQMKNPIIKHVQKNAFWLKTLTVNAKYFELLKIFLITHKEQLL